ncbi:tyrosine-type recombinase/integrase [Hyphomicrobium sp.]|uniref:tyrosine-type recombinase/integrase n=1 Tax=Hyphomicrobium sp. TaxID=82 RepID=UPI003F6F5308
MAKRKFEPQNRGGVWYLVRRVPKEYAAFDQRRFVKLTTGIRVMDDPRGARASRAVDHLNNVLEREWLDLSEGRDPKRRGFSSARATASSLGLAYATEAELAAGPLEEILRRIELLERVKGVENETLQHAVLGFADRPQMRLSDLLEAFEEAQAAILTTMSEGQRKRWRMNKARAIKVAISVLGDKSLLQLTRDDGIAFRRFFQKRIVNREIAINSANIEMGHFTKMLRTVEIESQLGIPVEAFASLYIEGGERQQRSPFERGFIQGKILAESALDGLKPEARCIVYMMVDTGMRPSEIINLLPQHIHLDAPVPYVSILPEGRRLKTKHSERDMPLVGCSLAAMRAQPNGFPSYLGQEDQASEEINDYLAAAKLRPTPKHSLYSLRHSFEDRLTTLDPPDKIIGRFMGHKQSRERYGDGPTLEHLHGWISRIALVPPARL